MRWAAYAAFAAAVVYYVVYFTKLTHDIHMGLGTSGFDYGIFDQGTWLLSRFHDPFVTINGRNLFGDHTSFILVLLVPFYWFASGATTLLTAQALVIGLAAVPVFLFARERLRSVGAAAVLGIAFLLHPAVAWTNLEEFHPDAFLGLTVGLALYGALTDRRRLLIVGTVLSLLVKEDVALLTVPLGIWVALRRNRKLGLMIVLGSIAYTAIALLVVIRSLLGTPGFYYGRIPFGGVGGLFRTTFTHPGRLFDYLSQNGRPRYVWQMLASGGLVFLAAPDVALIGVGVLGGNVISNFVYQHLIQYHYSLIVVPVLAFATVEAVARMNPILRQTAVAVVGTVAVLAAYFWGPLPFSRTTLAYWRPNNPNAVDVQVLRRSIPPGAVVSAYHRYVPHVDHRRRIYMFPTPFSARYYGKDPVRTDNTTLTNIVGDVEYVFIPDNLSAEDQAIWDHWKGHYVLQRRVGSALLYRRTDLPPGAG